MGRTLRIARFVSCSLLAATVFTALAAMSGSRDAEAQSVADASDAETGPKSACTFVVTGGLPSTGDCTVRMFHRAGTDASGPSNGFVLDGDSPELQSIAIWVSFGDSPPTSGVVPPPPPPGFGYTTPPSTLFGHAEVKARNGIEWVGISSVQGTFQMTVTSAKKIRLEGGTGYDIHGELEIEIPVSNLNSTNPRNKHRLLGLRASF